MNVKINFDIFKGALFTLLALALKVVTPSQIKVSAELGSGARSFPNLAIAIMLASGIGMVIKGFIKKDKQYFVVDRESVGAWKTPLIVLACIGIYMFLIPKAGFLISSVIAVNACLLFLKSRAKSHYIACNAVAITIFFVFTRYLNVLLPSLRR